MTDSYVEEVKKVAKEGLGTLEEEFHVLSTGSTLLNLACSNNPFGGFIAGKYYFLVGDSFSGKTFLAMSCLAEACQNPTFDNYRLIYDDVEGGNIMDIERLFGEKVADRLEPPGKLDDGTPVYSETIQDFYWNLDDAVQGEVPVIYVLDSQDGLSSESEQEKFQEAKTASRAGKTIAGSYGDGKAKINASGIRQKLGDLRRTGSILIITNQTRDNLGFGFEKKTRSGGHALKFYATVEMWTSVKGKITKTVKTKKRDKGIMAKIQVKKNRITGISYVLEIPILNDYGIDDISSCIQYLIEEGHWEQKKEGKRIMAPEFSDSLLSERKLIGEIEKTKNGYKKLQRLVGKVWNEILKATETERKPRYD